MTDVPDAGIISVGRFIRYHFRWSGADDDHDGKPVSAARLSVLGWTVMSRPPEPVPMDHLETVIERYS